MNMKPLLSVFLASVCVGHALGYVQRIAPTAQAQTQGASRDPNALPPAIPPVPNPPLYPDPPQGPAHWDIEEIRKIFEARRTAAKANPDQGFGEGPLAPGTPSFQGQTFRTHWMTGLLAPCV